MDWIVGDKFKSLADFTYAPNHKPYPRDDYDHLVNTLDLATLKNGDVIYTHMMYVMRLLSIMQIVGKKFVLISHSCDYSIEDFGMIRPNGHGKIDNTEYFSLPDNVIKWYSKNVNTINPRIESIPIGLENDRINHQVHKKEEMTGKLGQSKNYRNLVYLNFKIQTNPAERQPLYDMMKGKSWVTSCLGRNGVNFGDYLDNLYNHKFVLCPAGNGIDTVRLWETLYMGSIPIVKRCVNTLFYTDLPICMVDDWSQVTEDFLGRTWRRIKGTNWNLEKLEFEYWKNKIIRHDQR